MFFEYHWVLLLVVITVGGSWQILHVAKQDMALNNFKKGKKCVKDVCRCNFYVLLKLQIKLLSENDQSVNMGHSYVSLLMFYFIDKKSISYQRIQRLKNEIKFWKR